MQQWVPTQMPRACLLQFVLCLLTVEIVTGVIYCDSPTGLLALSSVDFAQIESLTKSIQFPLNVKT